MLAVGDWGTACADAKDGRARLRTAINWVWDSASCLACLANSVANVVAIASNCSKPSFITVVNEEDKASILAAVAAAGTVAG